MQSYHLNKTVDILMILVNQHLFVETHHTELAHNSEATHFIPASSLDKSSILMSVQH